MYFSTISSWSVLVWKALNAEGLDPEEIFNSAGVDPSKINKPGSRFAFSEMTALWSAASRASSAECFGLAAAEHWHPTTFQALGIAWLASYTLQEAFDRLVRHIDMLSTAAAAEFICNQNECDFKLRVLSNEITPHPEAIHATLVTLVHMCRLSIGKDFSPKRARLPLRKSSCDKLLKNFFNCDIEYQADEIGLVFATSDMQLPLPTGNQDLLLSTEKIIADYLKSLGRNDIISDVRTQIMRQLPSGEVSDNTIADALHMSTRTLQRRLKDQNIRYRDLLETVRQELADKYINDPGYSITEISYLLGFAEPSSFARSFKRWTGSSPSQIRKN